MRNLQHWVLKSTGTRYKPQISSLTPHLMWGVLPSDASWKWLCSSSVPPDDDDDTLMLHNLSDYLNKMSPKVFKIFSATAAIFHVNCCTS